MILHKIGKVHIFKHRLYISALNQAMVLIPGKYDVGEVSSLFTFSSRFAKKLESKNTPEKVTSPATQPTSQKPVISTFWTLLIHIQQQIRQLFWGCFWTLTFLANLLLNVNMLLTSPTCKTCSSRSHKHNF